MKRTRSAGLLILAACWLAGSAGHGEAGKWTPEQLLELDPQRLRDLGLELDPAALWSPGGGGLLEAVVQVGGCSSGFVSGDGLLVTNHHCAFGLLQQHSTPERDLIADGFLAASREEELPGAAVRASIPHRFTDVTAEISAAADAATDDLARYEAIESRSKELVAECESQPFRRCRVATYDDGVRYTLLEQLEFPDVRLVWAPPRAIGEYGGEVDNWSWPRHTGDFALLRVYAAGGTDPAPYDAANLPYRPRRHLEIGWQGVEEGQFVLVAGYPGRTFRRLVAAEMEERSELYFPGRARLYRAWLDILEAAGSGDEAARLALASRVQSLSNREKNARGQIAGILRGRLVEAKRAADRRVLAWADGRAAVGDAVAAYDELRALAEAARRTWEADFLLEQVTSGPLPLAEALTLVRWGTEGEKPDAERDPEFQERNRERARDRLERDQKRLHLLTEQRLLVDWLHRMARLPADQRPASLEPLIAQNDEEIETRVAHLLQTSKVPVLDQRLAMLDEPATVLRQRQDPLLELAFALDEEAYAPKRRRDRTLEGAVSRLRPAWRRAVAAEAGRPVDPDANGTLRLSLAHVRGYRPRDAVWMEPLTRLAGVVEKNTGEAPFAAPERLLAAAAEAPRSRWAAAALGDVPVCFLATGDTTGGSSGSPVLDGRGRLVGVNFDRVWENVANDFGYNPEIARNISADVRYLAWLLETLHAEAARPLLRELGAPGE